MTDEERQRQMEFIVNTLANITVLQEQAQLDRKQAELERKADAVRIGRVEESMVTLTQLNQALTQLAQRHDERLDEHQHQITNLRDEHQGQITDLKEAIVILTKIMNKGTNGQA
ncbi:MAG: hypothetical protein JO360_05355 [Acidobacteria bacterium]|nr:hypothetical protein [Acidobacteriota bacterium]